MPRVCVFAGGWSLEAAEAICPDLTGEDEWSPICKREILDLLSNLADKSMLAVGQTPQRTMETEQAVECALAAVSPQSQA